MFVQYLRSNGILYKHACGMRDVVGREFHDFDEIFLLRGGSAQFTSDVSSETLCPDALILIPKGSFHQFDVLCEEADYHRSVLQFDVSVVLHGSLAGRIEKPRILHTPPEEILALFAKLESLHRDIPAENDRILLLEAYFTELMMKLKYTPMPVSPPIHYDPVITEMLTYIGDHYREAITVEAIAERVGLSVSAAAHKFRSTMHIPIYRYIVKKRLSTAASLMSMGISAQQAAQDSGFGEYSSFYKLYRKYYGAAPTDTIEQAEA